LTIDQQVIDRGYFTSGCGYMAADCGFVMR